MRIGVFGGSFDPVHFGHLILAEQCREQARLDQVWFLPSARHPLKLTQKYTPFAQRVAMLELAIAGQPNFRIEPLENDRPGLSYTADTLDELQRRHPDAEFSWLLGADTLEELPQWYEPQRIIERATLVVMQRPPWPLADADAVREALALPRNVNLRMQRVDVPAIDIASRDLRQRVREGRTVRFMVPAAVEDYIVKNALYKS
jgi:nicotinate-nucleotide adenylyltransferase